jgi:predicted enzyme related to lactoylglutathione lyase
VLLRPDQKEKTMQPNHMMLFYVEDPLASADFYARILGAGAVDVSPGFAMFKLNDATMLGLWNKAGVEPRPVSAAGSSELGFHVGSNESVDAMHKSWVEHGVTIAQPPVQMDFGYTFTGLDPDGNRLRVFAPA